MNKNTVNTMLTSHSQHQEMKGTEAYTYSQNSKSDMTDVYAENTFR